MKLPKPEDWYTVLVGGGALLLLVALPFALLVMFLLACQGIHDGGW